MKLGIYIFCVSLMISQLIEKAEAAESLLIHNHYPPKKYTPTEIYSIRNKMTKEQLRLPEGSPERAAIDEFNKIMTTQLEIKKPQSPPKKR